MRLMQSGQNWISKIQNIVVVVGIVVVYVVVIDSRILHLKLGQNQVINS